MERGYVKIYKSLFDHEIWLNPELANCFKIWIWCLSKANWKPKTWMCRGEKVWINRGEFVSGSRKASTQLGVSNKTFWKWISYLEGEHMIRTNKTPKYTLFTIVNWEKYNAENRVGVTHTTHDVYKEKEEEYYIPGIGMDNDTFDQLFGN